MDRPCKEKPMLNTVRLYLDALLAVAIMTSLATVSGFVAAAITGDRDLVIAATAAAFILTGAVLVVRLWRTTHKPAVPPLDTGI
jgi:hypothetical protein